MSYLVIRLRPTGPWRIGSDSGDRDRVDRMYHSDSLYSAVTGAMARLGMLEEWLEATARTPEPAVCFSSCFPFNGETMYVPPPRNLWPPPASSKVRWKAARFVPLHTIESLVSGKAISEEGLAVDGASEALIAMGTQGPFRVSVRSSAAVDRGGAGVAPHSTACLEFAPNAGFWTAVAFANEAAREAWKARVTGALRLLGDSGFGGERSRGWGRAEIEIIERESGLLSSADTPGETGWWLLSLFHPGQDDSIDWARGNYSVIARGGRVESHAGWGELKRNTRMIAEGSVLVAAREPRGSATDVAPEGFPHPVYRSGFAFWIPVPLNVEPVRSAA
ncbi:MAG: type III-A CRISPR-associated RAMP protein Csm4 [Bryobacterales bacterium]|nr:type III-A CRISPR-associated RAMP protein Csm4 [Bryobacterales bacterium]MBV9396527.1 type III-A CRISPR-associated RAMP protein Csm4 [Bryobacterales bacterium]